MEEEKKEKKRRKKGKEKKKKPFGFMILFLTSRVQEGGWTGAWMWVEEVVVVGAVVAVVVGSRYSFIPLSLHLPSVCLRSPSLPTPASFCSIYSYSTVNHFYEEGGKKK